MNYNDLNIMNLHFSNVFMAFFSTPVIVLAAVARHAWSTWQSICGVTHLGINVVGVIFFVSNHGLTFSELLEESVDANDLPGFEWWQALVAAETFPDEQVVKLGVLNRACNWWQCV